MPDNSDAVGGGYADHTESSIAIETNESGGQKATDALPHAHHLLRRQIANARTGGAGE
jgi:hypothetical protein